MTTIAIAHDYLTQRGGAEKVVLAMARTFPDAPIYTLLYEPNQTFPEFAGLDVRVSPLNRIGPLRRNHRAALPLLPIASSLLKIDADIVITSTSGWAHGFASTGDRIVYCYSPARWLYQSERYLGARAGLGKRAALALLSPALRRWDRRAAAGNGDYLAISAVVEERIRDAYGRSSEVVPAPFTIDTTLPLQSIPELPRGFDTGFALCVSRLLPYKNVDRVIEAFRLRPDRRLVIVGRGPEESRLRADLPDNIVLLSDLSDAQLRFLYSRCACLVAASFEDYGLTPIEAAVFGKPSVALRWGGYLDTILEGVTGEFFDQPTEGAIAAALDRLENREWDAAAIRTHVDRFSEERFAEQLRRRVSASKALVASR